jgi:hypothetical protein
MEIQIVDNQNKYLFSINSDIIPEKEDVFIGQMRINTVGEKVYVRKAFKISKQYNQITKDTCRVVYIAHTVPAD